MAIQEEGEPSRAVRLVQRVIVLLAACAAPTSLVLSARWSDGLIFLLLGAGCGALSVFLLRTYSQAGTLFYPGAIGLVVSEAEVVNIVTFVSFMALSMWTVGVFLSANRPPTTDDSGDA